MSTEFILPRKRRRIRPYLDLTAMIDTVFNLLIFFAVTTTFVGARSAIPLNLPSAQTATSVVERVVLTVLPNSPVQINGQSVPINRVGAELKKAAADNTNTQVVIVADEQVPYAQLVAILDEVRLANYNKIALAASPKKGARTSSP